MRSIFILLSLIIMTGYGIVQIPVPDDANDNVTACALRIMNHHYHNRSVFAYMEHDDVTTVVTHLLRDPLKFIVLNANGSNMVSTVEGLARKNYFYVVVVKHISEYVKYIEDSYRTRGWNTHGKILVVYLGNDDITPIFQLSWKYFSMNVVVLTNALIVYTYFPITATNCGNNITSEIIYSCAEDITNVKLYPPKTGLTFYGCPLRVLPIVIQPYILDLERERNPGFEMVMLREISKHLDLKIVYIPHPYVHWGTQLADGTYTDMYSVLFTMEADMMIGMILSNESYAQDFDDTYPHSQCDLTFHVPTPLIVEGWKNFIIIFSPPMWYGFGISMVSCMFTWWIIGKNQHDSEGFDILTNCAFKVWCVVFSCFSMQPKNGLIRLIYMVWTLYAFLMVSTYTGVLIGFLTRPSYEKEIRTMEDMANSDLKYGGLYVIRYVFNEPGNAAYMTVYKKFINCALAMGCTNRTAFQRDFGTIKNDRQVAYFVPYVYTYPNGRPMVQRLRETVVPQNVWTNTLKGFIYMERWNDAVHRLREGGFIPKWDKEATNTWKKSIEEPPSVIPLTISHLKFGFYCLLAGHALAFVVLLWEARALGKAREYLKGKYITFFCWV